MADPQIVVLPRKAIMALLYGGRVSIPGVALVVCEDAKVEIRLAKPGEEPRTEVLDVAGGTLEVRRV